MIHSHSNLLRSTIAAVALLAAIVMSLLPGGYLPKVAGPCGRELCNCTESISLFSSNSCLDCTVKSVTPKLRLADVSITNSETPGRALQVIFTGMLIEDTICHALQMELSEELAIAHASFSLITTSKHIDIPPPRA